METDGFRQELEQLRQHVLLGVDHFHLGPVMLATLIDESDALEENYRYGEAYGLNKLLAFVGDEARTQALFELLGAERPEDGIYRLRFEQYVGCFWRQGDGWSWYPETLDGYVIDSPVTLVEKLLSKRN